MKYALQDIWGQVFHSWCINCTKCMHHAQSMSLFHTDSPESSLVLAIPLQQKVVAFPVVHNVLTSYCYRDVKMINAG